MLLDKLVAGSQSDGKDIGWSGACGKGRAAHRYIPIPVYYAGQVDGKVYGWRDAGKHIVDIEAGLVFAVVNKGNIYGSSVKCIDRKKNLYYDKNKAGIIYLCSDQAQW